MIVFVAIALLFGILYIATIVAIVTSPNPRSLRKKYGVELKKTRRVAHDKANYNKWRYPSDESDTEPQSDYSD
jgi:hypothetical protein